MENYGFLYGNTISLCRAPKVWTERQVLTEIRDKKVKEVM